MCSTTRSPMHARVCICMHVGSWFCSYDVKQAASVEFVRGVSQTKLSMNLSRDFGPFREPLPTGGLNESGTNNETYICPCRGQTRCTTFVSIMAIVRVTRTSAAGGAPRDRVNERDKVHRTRVYLQRIDDDEKVSRTREQMYYIEERKDGKPDGGQATAQAEETEDEGALQFLDELFPRRCWVVVESRIHHPFR
eukprot:GHVU01119476.1.p1 GENE.GHVU01119476.1~~GHVU01119476.1.p1  ORF type:complete len:194 (-),score=15.42 GHVU01119476.1:158-739(-)